MFIPVNKILHNMDKSERNSQTVIKTEWQVTPQAAGTAIYFPSTSFSRFQSPTALMADFVKYFLQNG